MTIQDIIAELRKPVPFRGDIASHQEAADHIADLLGEVRFLREVRKTNLATIDRLRPRDQLLSRVDLSKADRRTDYGD